MKFFITVVTIFVYIQPRAFAVETSMRKYRCEKKSPFRAKVLTNRPQRFKDLGWKCVTT
jgi:hypothetical protein